MNIGLVKTFMSKLNFYGLVYQSIVWIGGWIYCEYSHLSHLIKLGWGLGQSMAIFEYENITVLNYWFEIVP